MSEQQRKKQDAQDHDVQFGLAFQAQVTRIEEHGGIKLSDYSKFLLHREMWNAQHSMAKPQEPAESSSISLK